MALVSAIQACCSEGQAGEVGQDEQQGSGHEDQPGLPHLFMQQHGEVPFLFWVLNRLADSECRSAVHALGVVEQSRPAKPGSGTLDFQP